jgi:hypothetical protein
VVSERITLIEALSVAGDLTIYGKGMYFNYQEIDGANL